MAVGNQNSKKTPILLRRFLGVLIVFALCSPAVAQQLTKIPRLGFLDPLDASTTAARNEAFRQGLHDLGYVEGKNIVIEYRWAQGKAERLPDLAAELVRLKVDVIFARSTPAVQAATKMTTSVPIVSVSGDPVALGFVASLARPGGNITGLANLTPELAGKRLELLKEVIPRVSRVAVLWYPDAPGAELRVTETGTAAPALGIKLQLLEVREAKDFELAFSAMKKARADALVPLRGAPINSQLKRIVELAQRIGCRRCMMHGNFRRRADS
jgi:putative ABC transport system substrate-binding protein